MKLKDRLHKYLVMGSVNCDRAPEEILREAIKGGITAFQYREKGEGALQGKEKLQLGLLLRQICKQHGVLFIINDDTDLAEALNADGIHVGQSDESPAALREVFPDKIIGLSVSSWAEVEKSPIGAVDYLGAGPMFSTTSKADAKNPVGPEWVRELRKKYPSIPIVGIGGISCGNSNDVLSAGADGVAVISAVTQAADIPQAVRQL
ncbi:thiamine-phosphate synthase [Thalassobacillus devorans]|uniref:Thiamine-phosphate synthase n=1 Tax=Thalassobacillus devorans TaxID=279813 RepID=A0ABQ1PFL2_9BACI|nr:thiamine phosphate synthase [Thalassobacillus devorans]NIK29380.1 thiamine-phosphate pyrophosphorylase [Thalassobacillus devorans]GGC96217.1 thiamine-phosphate synthase [Thalassobacillus devorans]